MEEKKKNIKRDLFRTVSNRKGYSKNAGITLIALVVTIVVLVILAGVSIPLVLGQYGIIGRAQNAGETQRNAQNLEEAYLQNADLYINEQIAVAENGKKEKVYLYNKGDECISLTGGWNWRKTPRFDNSDISYSKNNSLYINTPNGYYYCQWYTNLPINMKDYSKIVCTGTFKFTPSSTNFSNWQIVATKENSYTNGEDSNVEVVNSYCRPYGSSTVISNEGEYIVDSNNNIYRTELDISEVSKSCFLVLMMRINGSMDVEECWME